VKRTTYESDFGVNRCRTDSFTLSLGAHPNRSPPPKYPPQTPQPSSPHFADSRPTPRRRRSRAPRAPPPRTISATSITLMSSSLAISNVSVPVSPLASCSSSRSALRTYTRHVLHVDEVPCLRAGLVDGQRFARERPVHEEIDHGRLAHRRPVDDVLAVEVRLQKEVRGERAVGERLDRALAEQLRPPVPVQRVARLVGRDRERLRVPNTAMLNGNASAAPVFRQNHATLFVPVTFTSYARSAFSSQSSTPLIAAR